jgi:hypothetical protein
MRLSTAIREGAKLKPQAFGANYRDGGTCAWGAALNYEGVMDAQGHVDIFRHSSFLDDSSRNKDCPECGKSVVETDLITIAHLNDHHRWSRQRIADWVEQIENEEAAKNKSQEINNVEHRQEVPVAA